MPNGEIEDASRMGAMRDAIQAVQDEQLRKEIEGKLMGARIPIGGEYILNNLEKAKTPEQVQLAAEGYLAVREGVYGGPWFWDLENKKQAIFLLNLFTTAESSMVRPAGMHYVETELDNRMQGSVWKVNYNARLAGKTKIGELSNEEREVKSYAIGWENHQQARLWTDYAFVQRQKACENWEHYANLLEKDPEYRRAVEPDRGHWQSLFAGQWGQAVNEVMWEMVRAGLTKEQLKEVGLTPISTLPSEPIYVEAIKDTEVFIKWLSYMQTTARGDMSAVWSAWRNFLLFEIPGEMAVDKSTGRIRIGDPPIISDFAVWAANLKDKREVEFGLDASGRRISITWYPSHVGYPISLPIEAPFHSFPHQATVTIGEKYVPLWNIWWQQRVSFADPKFPWAQTEKVAPVGEEELPLGSFGLWRLNQMRTVLVVKDIRSRPNIRDLGDPDFFGSKARNWDKVFGTYETYKKKHGKEWPPEENPRALWVAGLLTAHHRKDAEKLPIVKGDKDKAYQTYYPMETWSGQRKGEAVGLRNVSIFEILDHAKQCDFLRTVDTEWLMDELNVKPPKI